MKVLILSEPRSGSTNLANWFYFNKDFTTLFIPSDPKSNWYQKDTLPKDYIYKTPHLLIKEDYYHYKDYSKFIEISDKVVCLYRKNENEQIQSWINSKMTNVWHNEWVWKEKNYSIKEDIFFKELKQSFKEKCLDKEEYFKISYEELYYDNGFQKILNYLEIEQNNKPFPIGKKYRINVTNTGNLI